MKTVLLTGAAGNVGSDIRTMLAERYEKVILTDISVLRFPLLKNEEFYQGDITDKAFVESLVAKVDGVVHLACAHGLELPFDKSMSINIDATHCLLAASVKHRIKAFVFASSHHALGFTPRPSEYEARLDHLSPTRPDSYYGFSKVAGESLCALFSDRDALRTFIIRIGNVDPKVADPRRLQIWSSARDIMQLVQIGLEHTGYRHEIVYGISDCPNSYFNNANARRLGYVPKDKALDNLASAEVLAMVENPQSISSYVVGGQYATYQFSNSIQAILGKTDEN